MPTFLHIGCGEKSKANTTAGFNTPAWTEVRLDIDPDAKPDIVASMTDMAAVAGATMDAIYSSHNIEHLYPADVAVALREFARVLKPDGFAVITCPDLQSVAALIAEGKLMEPAYNSAAGPISPIDILYGLRPSLAEGDLFMAHRTGFIQSSLSTALHDCGFSSVIVRQRPRFFDLWALAMRLPADADRLRDLAAQHFPAQR